MYDTIMEILFWISVGIIGAIMLLVLWKVQP